MTRHPKSSLLSAAALSCFLAAGPSSAALVSYYPFDANFDDAVGNADPNAPAVGEDPEIVSTGVFGSSALFDGDDGLVVSAGNDLSDLAGSSGLSVSAWILPTADTNTAAAGGNVSGIIGAQVPGSNQLFQLQLVGDDLRSIVWTDVDPPATGTGFNVAGGNFAIVPLGGTEFIHVAYTWDGSDLTRYLNGVAIPQDPVETVGDTLTWQSGTPGDISIGRSQPGNSAVANFKGNIDDLAIFNRALTPEEVAGLADMSLTPLAIPEPMSACLLALGLVPLAGRSRRRAS